MTVTDHGNFCVHSVFAHRKMLSIRACDKISFRDPLQMMVEVPSLYYATAQDLQRDVV